MATAKRVLPTPHACVAAPLAATVVPMPTPYPIRSPIPHTFMATIFNSIFYSIFNTIFNSILYVMVMPIIISNFGRSLFPADSLSITTIPLFILFIP